ncbi:hypothetical protein Ocin01_07414 [Orchesella cincta]|uniref:Uncharacterized protein n=1 Tax=Orchesella cincta TaxID=48709 RepID=A0A1D2N1W2_ORCCI|nr:hypothetical protein Ocin01_07414 [Orchesella cincta]
MFHNFVCTFAWLVAITLAKVEGQFVIPQPGYQLNGSEFVDRVLENVREQVITLGLDPLNLPSIHFRVNNESVALRNGTIRGLSNIHRVGPVVVNVTILDTKYRSAFAVYNVSADQDVQIQSQMKNISYPNGHVHMDCDNVTVYQVFKLDHITQVLSLDEFELSIGECNYNVTGLGERAQNNSATINEIFARTKGPVLAVFNITFKILVNVALQAGLAFKILILKQWEKVYTALSENNYLKMVSKKLSATACLVLVVLITYSNAFFTLPKIGKSGNLEINGNKIVDNVLETIQKTIKTLKLDPIKTLPFDLGDVSLRNGTINGLSNIQRDGDVKVEVGLTSTLLTTSLAIVDMSTDEDVKLGEKKGHVHTECEEVTAHAVFKMDTLTSIISLKKFELSIGDYEFKVTGLGKDAKATGKKINDIFNAAKGPILKIISTALQTAINVALASMTASLFIG